MSFVRPSCNTLVLLALTAICVLVVDVTHASFVLHVSTQDERCFVVRAPADNSLLSGNFDVLDDTLSADPIVVKILEGESMSALYESSRGMREDTFRVALRSGDGRGGRYYVCVQNGYDYESDDELDRSVGLDIRVSPLPAASAALGAAASSASQAAAKQLAKQAELVNEKLWDLETHFDYMRSREASHRETTEQTFTNVVRWSLLECGVLLGMALSQIVALRVFFERKRYI